MTAPTPRLDPIDTVIPGIGEYRKFVTAALGGVAVVFLAAVADDRVTTPEAIAVAVAVAYAFATYQLPNTTDGVGRYVKFIAGLVATGLTATGQVAFDGFTASDVTFVAVQLLTAAGVLVMPNTPTRNRG